MFCLLIQEQKQNLKYKFPNNAINKNAVLTNLPEIFYSQKIATIFATFSKDGFILDNTLEYIKELKKYSDFLVVVADCPLLENEILKLNSIADAYIIKRHDEYDFGSYKRGFYLLKNLNILNNIENIIFCNDSVLFNGNSLERIIISAKSHDFFGITINKDGYNKKLILAPDAPHIQSYFMSISKNIFQKKFFIDFINSIKKQKNKRKIIYNYEQGLSRIITSNGFDMYSYYPIRENDNKYPDPYFYYLNFNDDFLEERFFLKKNLVSTEIIKGLKT